MRLSRRTVLITGGASGLGLALAAELLRRGNTVVAVGRSEEKLARARAAHPGLQTRACDVSQRQALIDLAAWVTRELPALDVLINNAGVMNNWDIPTQPDALEQVEREIATNLLGPIQLSSLLLGHLRSRPEAAIVNVSSGAAYLPMADAPVYCATKAALHSFTLSLRHQLRQTRVAVVELVPPTVTSEMSAGRFKAESRFAQAMPVERFVEEAIRGLEQDVAEIRVGLTGLMVLATRLVPGYAIGRALATRSTRSE